MDNQHALILLHRASDSAAALRALVRACLISGWLRSLTHFLATPGSGAGGFRRSFVPEVQGTGHDATPWGLLMFPHPLPARVGDQEKIVWRMTGTA